MRLELTWRDREVAPYQTPRRFLDLVVDGESLYDRFGREHDRISCLGWLGPAHDEGAARRLLGDAAPDLEGRVMLYVCPECADEYCGALTVSVEQDGSTVVWRDVCYSGYDGRKDAWHHTPVAPALRHELRFDRRELEAVLRAPVAPPGT